MNTKVFYEKYRKLSIAALITGILAISFCILYFLIWELIGNLLQRLIADVGFMRYIIISFICSGIGLTIAAVVTGSTDLKRIKKGIYSRRGIGFDITGIILGSLLILFALIFYLAEFFNLTNLI